MNRAIRPNGDGDVVRIKKMDEFPLNIKDSPFVFCLPASKRITGAALYVFPVTTHLTGESVESRVVRTLRRTACVSASTFSASGYCMQNIMSNLYFHLQQFAVPSPEGF